MFKNRNQSNNAPGEWGERIAERFLRKKGFRILGRRVRVGTRDEFDLVGTKDDILVFIEVKTRKNENFGRPFSAVTRNKRHVLSRAAVRYIKAKATRPVSFRFDVVEVIGQEGGVQTEIRHIENAFKLDRCYRIP